MNTFSKLFEKSSFSNAQIKDIEREIGEIGIGKIESYYNNYDAEEDGDFDSFVFADMDWRNILDELGSVRHSLSDYKSFDGVDTKSKEFRRELDDYMGNSTIPLSIYQYAQTYFKKDYNKIFNKANKEYEKYEND